MARKTRDAEVHGSQLDLQRRCRDASRGEALAVRGGRYERSGPLELVDVAIACGEAASLEKACEAIDAARRTALLDVALQVQIELNQESAVDGEKAPA